MAGYTAPASTSCLPKHLSASPRDRPPQHLLLLILTTTTATIKPRFKFSDLECGGGCDGLLPLPLFSLRPQALLRISEKQLQLNEVGTPGLALLLLSLVLLESSSSSSSSSSAW